MTEPIMVEVYQPPYAALRRYGADQAVYLAELCLDSYATVLIHLAKAHLAHEDASAASTDFIADALAGNSPPEHMATLQSLCDRSRVTREVYNAALAAVRVHPDYQGGGATDD